MKSKQMFRRNFLALTFGMAVALMWLAAPGKAQAADGPPNFILILTDDQSWVGSSALMDPENPETKSDYFQTPNIERLMDMGMRFTQGYAPAPLCCPTRRSIQVGQTPARHLMQKDQDAWPARYRKQLNIPRMLKATDPRYQTAHFGKWDHRYDEVTPEEQGYDVSDGYTGNGTGGGKGSGGPSAKEDPKLMRHITDQSISFMRKQVASQNPFFVQLSHYAVHLDIFYRQETLEKTSTWKPGRRHRMPEFAAMTYDVDETIGQILDEVQRLGIADNTYIFFLSDNGGRNTMPKSPEAPLVRNYPLRDGKTSMYEGGLRVPFAVVGPNIQHNSISRVPVTGLDILPTLAELAGYNKPLPKNIDGGSMLSVLNNKGQGEVRRNNPFLIFHHSVSRAAETALRLGDLKLVKTWNENRLELFDLSKDLSEAHDLSTAMPEQTQKLHGLMTNYLDSVNADTNAVPRPRPPRNRRNTSAPAGDSASMTLESDADLEAIKDPTRLERLDVLSGNITDAGVKHVQNLTNIKMLSLKGSKVTDAGLKYLQGLAQLEMLSLERTQVAGPGLQHLADLPKLRYLNLRGTPVSDASLDFLTALITLERLRLDGSEISEAGVQKIREALPDCRISPSATQLSAFVQNAYAENPPELQSYLRQSTTWHSPKLEKDIPLNIYFADKRSASPQQAPVIVYVKGLAAERVGQESDLAILSDYIEQRYIVITVDYGGDARAVSPAIDEDLHAILGVVYGTDPSRERIVDSPLLSALGLEPTPARCFFLPAGYRVATDLVFWEVDKHGSHGTMKRVVQAYNEQVVNERGRHHVPGRSRISSPDELIERDGSPLDYKHRMDIIYPSQAKKKAPLIFWVSTTTIRAPSSSPSGYRPHMTGFPMRGYAYAIFDHCYNPVALRYGHYKGHALSNINGLKSYTAAIRFIRAHADDYNIDSRYIGGWGHSKGAYALVRLSDPNHAERGVERQILEGEPEGSPEPQPWPGYSSRIAAGYQSMGNGTRWSSQYVTADYAPTIVACGEHDHFNHWRDWPQVLKAYESVDANHVALGMLGLGHELAHGRDEALGVDRYELVMNFFDRYLKVEENLAPVVLYMTPPDKVEDVAPSEPIVIQFAPVMDESSVVDGRGVKITRSSDSSSVEGSWSSSRGGARFTFTPKENLAAGEQVKVIVTTRVKNSAGTPLDEARIAEFTVGKMAVK